MAAQDIVNRVFRNFTRYTGDGLTGEPTGAPLPIGDPQSGVHNPKKADLRAALLAVLGAYFDQRGVETLADLNEITPDEGTQPVGVVYDDPTVTNNGYYIWDGDSWEKQRGFPDTLARVTFGGTANAQTGTATAGVNPADVELFIGFVTTDNTGPMTLSIGGETARDVVNAAGEDLSGGEWTGIVLFVLNDEGDYQLVIDAGAAAAAAASAAAAEADRILAEAARDAAQAAGANEFASTRTALKALDTSEVTHVYLTEAGREGQFVFRAGDYSALVTADSAEGVYIKADDTASTSGAWVRLYGDEALVTWFGALNDGAGSGNVTANNAALAAAKAWILAELSAAGVSPQLAFPPGIYDYDDFPNFAIQDTAVVGKGEARLRYHGTEHAVVYDGSDGTDATGVSNVTFGPFHIDCPPTAKDGFQAKWIRRNSRIVGINVHGAGPTYAGIRAMACVCASFINLTVSVNEPEGWYLGAEPLYGMVLDFARYADDHPTNPGEIVPGSWMSYSSFWDAVIEGMEIGVDFANGALGNAAYGGTFEGCPGAGARFAADAYFNKIINVDFEANTAQDILFLGENNEVWACNALTKFRFASGANGNRVMGGTVRLLDFDLGAQNNYCEGVTLNHYTPYVADAIIGDGVAANRFHAMHDAANNKWSNGPRVVTALPGPSPIIHTNGTPDDVIITIHSGTVNFVYFAGPDGVDQAVGTPRYIILRPGDRATIDYSGSPTVNLYRG